MSFIPRSPSLGDYVTITTDIANAEGTFQAGREFEIIEIYGRRGMTYYDLRDHEQRVLLEVPAELTRLSRLEGES